MLKFLFLLSFLIISVSTQRGSFFDRGQRQQRQRPFFPSSSQFNTLNLPDGAEFVVGQVREGFSCEGRRYGYYADVSNHCRVFHVCLPVTDENGFSHTLQWSFFCGNQTAFNQETLTCDHEFDVDCSRAESFYFVNDEFGKIPPRNRF